MGDHSSGTTFARRLKQPTRMTGGNGAHKPSLFGFAPGGVYHAATVTGLAVRSYRTLSPLPVENGRSALCGTFPGVAPAGRYPAPSLHGARTFLGVASHDAIAQPSGVVGRSADICATKAVPARSPSRPPKAYPEWAAGRGSGPVPRSGTPEPNNLNHHPAAWEAKARAGSSGTRHPPRHRPVRGGSGAGTP